MKRILPLLGVLGIVIVLVYFFFTQKVHAPTIVVDIPTTTSQQTTLSSETTNTPTQVIEVTSPRPNDSIKSPLILTGKARGSWYFEASFPIELRDANNVLIAKAVGQAQGDWMTENMVPFTATITFPAQPQGSHGMITLKNDNPSGEPEKSMMFDVPVTF
ncbi:MAG: Gmad2 immunoglobulin-like domain-containing protein [bacterium]